jgi:hypothetical protein
MSSDDDEAMPDSEGCPSDDARNSSNATDDDATPSQYKKSRRDDDDDEAKENESEDVGEEANEPEELIKYEAGIHAEAIDRARNCKRIGNFSVFGITTRIPVGSYPLAGVPPMKVRLSAVV